MIKQYQLTIIKGILYRRNCIIYYTVTKTSVYFFLRHSLNYTEFGIIAMEAFNIQVHHL